MVMEFAVRAARMKDAAFLARLSTELGYPTDEREARRRLEEILPRSEHAVLVAEGAEGAPIGWIHVYMRDLLVNDRHVEIGGLIVDANHRGKGIGRKLMQEAERWTASKGLSTVLVRSRVQRAEAHDFYLRIGYQCSKEQRVFMKRLRP
jgi:GNAT superfamily N-acetyltransferase